MAMLLLLVLAVALAGLYLHKGVHKHMVLTGEATINGKLQAILGVKQKTMAGLEAFPNVKVNMVIPRANTVDSAVWTSYSYIERGREDFHSSIRRE